MKKLIASLAVWLCLLSSAVHADITTGLVGHWKFDDGFGTTAVDDTGGTNGALQNTPTWVAGQIGPFALRLVSASSQYVTLASPTTALSDFAAVTVASWINCASFPNAYNAIFARTDINASFYQLFVRSDGKLASYVNASIGSISVDPATTALSVNTWYHVGFTYDSVAGLIVYVSAASDGTGAAQGTLSAADGAASIGEDLATTGRFLDCKVDDTRVYSRALTGGDMTELKNFTEATGNFVARRARQ